MPYILRFIVLLLALYFLGVLVFRYILPAILKWWVKRKLKQRGYKFDDRRRDPRRKQKEGDVNIHSVKNNNKKKNDNDGDYVDFEDIK
jgi:hypothetical protein